MNSLEQLLMEYKLNDGELEKLADYMKKAFSHKREHVKFTDSHGDTVSFTPSSNTYEYCRDKSFIYPMVVTTKTADNSGIVELSLESMICLRDYLTDKINYLEEVL